MWHGRYVNRGEEMPVRQRIGGRGSFGAVAVGSTVALVAGLLVAAPSAQAAVLDSAVSSQVMFSTPAVQDEQRALSTGARQGRLVYQTVPMLTGFSTYRTNFRPGPGFTFDKVGMQILACPNATTIAVSECREVERKEITGPFGSNIIRSDDLTIELDDADYGRIYRGNLQIYLNGSPTPSANFVSQAYNVVMQQPQAGGPPRLLDGIQNVLELDVGSTDPVNYQMNSRGWGDFPVTNVQPTRTVTQWVCDSADAGQVESFTWDQSGCEIVIGTQLPAATPAQMGQASANINPERFAEHVGRYLVMEEKLSYSSLVAGGVTVAVRSLAYPIVNTAAPQQNQNQNQQAAPQQQNQQAGQQQQGQQQNNNQQAGQQQNSNQQQAAAAGVPTGAAALRLNYSQAPLVSTNGVGTVAGTTLTVKSPKVHKRGKRKKTYRAIVAPKYKGRVAFVLTRNTPKGKMIVAKSKVKSTGKNGKATIRWKFAKKKPAGTYTLYVSFIPKARYGKPGLTVSKPISLR